jgi:tetratricopeptide (TPR) repeat protein
MEQINVRSSSPRINFFNLSKDYCIKGLNMADEGNLKAALENFDKAILTNPDNHIAYFNRATIKIDLGDLDGARNDFIKFDNISSKII